MIPAFAILLFAYYDLFCDLVRKNAWYTIPLVPPATPPLQQLYKIRITE